MLTRLDGASLMRLLALLIGLSLVPSIAQAQAQDIEERVPGLLRDFNAGTFAFVKPGATTPAAARKLLGEPYLSYTTWVKQGQVDIFVSAPTPETIRAVHESARKDGKGVEEVQVLEWRNEAMFTEAARLVFQKDILWYALVPVTPSESSLARLKDRYGRDPLVSTRTITIADVIRIVKVHAYPDRGVAYVEEQGTIRFKAVFAPKPQR